MPKKSWTDGLKDALSQAADAVTGGAKTVVDYGTDSARTVLSYAEKESMRLYYAAEDSVASVVRRGRNVAADVVRHGGSATGAIGGLAGEVALIVSGGFPFLVLGGLPSELGYAFAKQCARASISFRGTEPQFVGVRCEERMMKIFGAEDRVFAILYDPQHKHADEAGFVQLDEEGIAARGVKYADDRRGKATFTTALLSVQEAKVERGIALNLPDIRESIESETPASPKPKI